MIIFVVRYINNLKPISFVASDLGYFIIMNIPYKKQYVDGILVNPITKQNPYLQDTGKKRENKFRQGNNTQGFSMLIVRTGVLTFDRFKKVFQFVKGKRIQHLQLCK